MKRALPKNQTARAGLLKADAMLSMLILIVAMNFAAPMIARINHLWSDTQRHQFAIDELSNQMDVLVRMTPAKAATALKDLHVSEAFQKAAPQSTLSGELAADKLGRRVTLSLSWLEVPGAKPVQLSGWLVGKGTHENDDHGGEP